MKCLFDQCEFSASTRGLCAHHYQLAARRIRQGRTNWNELEALGMAKSARRGERGSRLKGFDTLLAERRFEH
jgi:hypothetical protein